MWIDLGKGLYSYEKSFGMCICYYSLIVLRCPVRLTPCSNPITNQLFCYFESVSIICDVQNLLSSGGMYVLIIKVFFCSPIQYYILQEGERLSVVWVGEDISVPSLLRGGLLHFRGHSVSTAPSALCSWTEFFLSHVAAAAGSSCWRTRAQPVQVVQMNCRLGTEYSAALTAPAVDSTVGTAPGWTSPEMIPFM